MAQQYIEHAHLQIFPFMIFYSHFSRWADKSLSVIMFENGHGGVNSDHTPFDAMVNVVMSHFIGKICLLNMCFRLSCLGFTASNSISSQYSVP